MRRSVTACLCRSYNHAIDFGVRRQRRHWMLTYPLTNYRHSIAILRHE